MYLWKRALECEVNSIYIYIYINKYCIYKSYAKNLYLKEFSLIKIKNLQN